MERPAIDEGEEARLSAGRWFPSVLMCEAIAPPTGFAHEQRVLYQGGDLRQRLIKKRPRVEHWKPCSVSAREPAARSTGL